MKRVVKKMFTDLAKRDERIEREERKLMRYGEENEGGDIEKGDGLDAALVLFAPIDRSGYST